MTLEASYENVVISFGCKRHELLELIAELIPRPAELHRRRWRVQLLDNTIADLKSTLTACNNQIDTERAKLDELNSQCARLRGQEEKLTQDLKILQGVTGMKVAYPSDIRSQALDEIYAMSDEFRVKMTDLYFDLTPIRQSLPVDLTIEKDSLVLVSTMEDFIRVEFDSRANEAYLCREALEKTEAAQRLEREVRATELRLEREIAEQEKRILTSGDRIKEAIDGQADEVKREGEKINAEYKKMTEDLEKSVRDLAEQEIKLRRRCDSLEQYNQALKANLRRLAKEVERELEQFEHRLKVIKKTPKTVDVKLVNMSMILGEKSSLIHDAVAEMRREIASVSRTIRA
jgi:chromosome segregation ATPase